MTTGLNLKEIDGYEGKYLISDCGRVFSRCKGKFVELKTQITHKGYVRVSLSKNNKNKHYKVHRLVAMYFNPEFHSSFEVNHLDGDKQNNKLENLDLCTGRANYEHSVIFLGRNTPKQGSELEKYLQLKQKLFFSY